MNIDNITPSILNVTPLKDLEINNDLDCEQTKSIAQLIEEKDEEKEKEDPEKS